MVLSDFHKNNLVILFQLLEKIRILHAKKRVYKIETLKHEDLKRGVSKARCPYGIDGIEKPLYNCFSNFFYCPMLD